jgi:hypothetical protein
MMFVCHLESKKFNPSSDVCAQSRRRFSHYSTHMLFHVSSVIYPIRGVSGTSSRSVVVSAMSKSS